MKMSGFRHLRGQQLIGCLLALLSLNIETFCNKSADISNANQFFVAGRIIDTSGNGLANIKVYYQTNAFVLSNQQGYWRTATLQDSATITPIDSIYTFLPITKKVLTTDSTLVFTAQLIPQQSPTAQQMYRWFTYMQLPNGLLESTENGNVVSLYDNALAALVFMAFNDIPRAELLFNYFNNKTISELQSGNGGFFQFRDKNGVPNGNRWLGDNAWLLIALNNYEAKTNSHKYDVLTNALSAWIQQQQDTDGGLWGGTDNNNARIGKVTEGNIDAFNAIAGFTSFHQNLLLYLKLNRWNTSNQLLMSWPGNTYVYALDNHSWGYCAFEDFPTGVLDKAAIYINTQKTTLTNQYITGYCFDIDRDDVWLEGTGQMVVALKKANQTNAANIYLAEMQKLIISSSLYPSTLGMPYASNKGTGYGTDVLWTGSDTKPCISSSAWYLFGYLNFDPMAIGYRKNIPTTSKFWLN